MIILAVKNAVASIWQTPVIPATWVTEAEIKYKPDSCSKTLPQKEKKNARDVVWCVPNICEEDLGMALGTEKKKSQVYWTIWI